MIATKPEPAGLRKRAKLKLPTPGAASETSIPKRFQPSRFRFSAPDRKLTIGTTSPASCGAGGPPFMPKSF